MIWVAAGIFGLLTGWALALVLQGRWIAAFLVVCVGVVIHAGRDAARALVRLVR